MSRSCAYCGDIGNLTREHIFPSSILSRYTDLITSNDKSDRSFYSDLVVKDVCARCNNGPLSKLDDEFLQVFDKYMMKPIMPGLECSLKFDYDILTRFLLKVTYNSARASINGERAVAILQKNASYILGETDIRPNAIIRLQIFTSARKYNYETKSDVGLLEARFLRSAKLAYTGRYKENFAIRLIAFNSFWFYIILPVSTVSRLKKDRFIREFEKWSLPSGIPITPQMSSLLIPKNKTSYIHPSILKGMVKPMPK